MTPPNQSFQGLCTFLCIHGLFALIYGKVECGHRGQKRTLHPPELPATWRGCWCSRPERGPPSPTGPSLQAPNQQMLGKTENYEDRRIWLNLSPAKKQEFQGTNSDVLLPSPMDPGFSRNLTRSLICNERTCTK